METVLVVGSSDGREMYAEYFRAQGLLVREAVQPQEALALVDDVSPAVVITDCVFPGSPLDAVTFLRALRRRLDAATSIVVVSGTPRAEDREALRAGGADLFLLEPVLPSEVFYEVKRALILRRTGRRLGWNWPDKPQTAPGSPSRRRGTMAS